MSMSNNQSPHVAIIGAGLSGLCLALALDQQGIKSTIYESRASPLNIGGAVMLSPNALRILDALGIYDTIKTKGHNFDTLHFRDLDGNITEEYPFGSESQYGYRGLRIYRTVLINALLEACSSSSSSASSNISIQFNRKFHHVVRETSSDVTFAFAAVAGDGTTTSTTETATLLVGADGIHSTVRRHLYPDLTPKFTGMAGITAAVPTSQLSLPEGYHIPVTIVNPTLGAFVIAPQGTDGQEVIIGRQKRFSPSLSGGKEPTREEWDAIHKDKAGSVAFLRDGIIGGGGEGGGKEEDPDSGFPDLVRNALREVDERTVNVWPFYVVPRLESWVSSGTGTSTSSHGVTGRSGEEGGEGEVEGRESGGRVVILGDAAHAIPPSAGQGINQAFEDSYMLGLLMGGLAKKQQQQQQQQQQQEKGQGLQELDKEKLDFGAAIKFWQRYRQERVDRILELNRQIDLRRMPKGDAADEVASERFDLGWLYQLDIRKDVQDWVAGR